VPISECGFYQFVYRSLNKEEGEEEEKNDIFLS